jgi:hypothetical protein
VPLLVVLASVACLFVLLRSGHQDAVHDAGSGTHRDAAGVTGRRVTPPVPTQVPATGTYVESRILANGDLQVTHWIRSRTPVASLALRLPEMSDATTPLSASGVLVAAGDQRADGARTLRSGGTTYRLARPSKVVYVRYALHGAVEQRGSVLGRALARVTSLDLRYGRPYGPTEVDVLGAKVLAVACTPRADQESIPRPCGGPGPGRWRVRLHGSSRTDRVMAQIELG